MARNKPQWSAALCREHEVLRRSRQEALRSGYSKFCEEVLQEAGLQRD